MEDKMKKSMTVMFAAMVLILGNLVTLNAADALKVGIVDFQKILAESDTGKAARTEINKKGRELEDSLKSRGEEIEELKKKIDRESLVMSKEKLEEKHRELRIKINDFKSMQKNYADRFKEMEARLINQIKRNVLEIARDTGEKQGFSLILEGNEAGVIYFSEPLDITDSVIKAYNSRQTSE